MAQNNKINLNIDTTNIDSLISKFEEASKQGGQVGKQATIIRDNLYKLQTAIEQGGVLSANAFNKITSAIGTAGKTIKGLNDPAALANLKQQAVDFTKTIEEATKQLAALQAKQNALETKAATASLQLKGFDPQDENFSKNYSQLSALQGRSHQSIVYDANKKASDEISEADIQTAQQYVKIYKDLQQAELDAAAAAKENQKAITAVTKTIETNQAAVVSNKAEQRLYATDRVTIATEAILKETNAFTENIQAQGATKDSTLQLNDANKKSSSVFEKTTSSLIGWAAALRMIKRVLREGINTVTEMDSSITSMTVVTGKSREEALSYVSAFQDMAQATSSTMVEMASLTTEFLRQGRAMKDAQTLAVQTARAAKIAGISVSDSLTYMTSAINGFNLAASAAEHVSDIFAKLAAVSATDYESLAIALSKVSAQANQAGMSIEYTTALLAKGIETTQEAPESIGTALKTVIARFRELSDFGSTLEDGVGVNAVENALAAVGISLRDTSGEFRSLTEVLNELGPKWDNFTGMQRQAIAQAVAGTRQQSRFLAIMQNWDRTLELVNEAQNSAGASAAQYSQYAKGMTAAITNLQNAWQKVVTAITDSEAIIDLIGVATNFLNFVSQSKVLQLALETVAGIAAYKLISSKLDEVRLHSLQKQKMEEEGLNEAERLRNAAIKMNQEDYDALIKEKQDELALAKEQLKATFAQQREEALTAKITQDNLAKRVAETKRLAIAEEQVQRLKKGEDASIVSADVKRQRTAVTKELNTALNANKTAYDATITTINTNEQTAIAALTKSQEKQQKVLSEYANKTAQNYNILSGTLGSIISGFSRGFSSIGKIISKNIITPFKTAAASSSGIDGVWKGIGGIFETIGPAVLPIVAAAAAIGAIYFAAKQILAVTNAESDALSKISELYTTINQQTTKKQTIQSLVDEYNKLNRTLDKSADDLERMQEIEESLVGEYGASGTGSDIILSAQEQIIKLDAEIKQGTEDAMVEAIKAGLITGTDILKKSEFLQTFKNQMSTYNTANTNTAQGQAQSATYSKVTDNIDYSKIKNQITERNAAMSAAGAGALGGTLATSATLGILAMLSGPIGWVTAGLATVAALAGGIGAGIGLQLLDTQKQAELTAEEIRKIMEETAQQINAFSESMSAHASSSYADRYAAYVKYMKETKDTMSDITRDAIEDANKSFEVLRSLNLSAEDIKTLQGQATIDGVVSLQVSDQEFENLLDLFSSLGAESGKEFVSSFLKSMQTSGNASATSAALALLLNGSSKSSVKQSLIDTFSLTPSEAQAIVDSFDNMDIDSAISDKLEKAKQAAADAKAAYGETVNNEEQAKKDFEQLRKTDSEYSGMTFKEYQAMLKQERDEAAQDVEDVETLKTNATTALLHLISSYDNVLSLSQGLTSISSATENAQEFADAIRDGTASLDDWAEAAIKYVDILTSEEFKQALAIGDTDAMANLLLEGNTVQSQLTNYYNEIDNFIKARNTELAQKLQEIDSNEDLTDSEKKEQRDALIKQTESQINSALAMKQQYGIINKIQQQTLINNKKIADAQENINNGNLKGYDQMEEALQKQIELNKEQQDAIFKQADNPQLMKKIYEQVKKGDFSLYNTLTDKEKAYFGIMKDLLDDLNEQGDELATTLAENNRAKLDAIVSMQETAISSYKAQLQEEYDATKENLDKRKDLYQKYFDYLNQEEDNEDYEAKRKVLLNTIAKLSGASDAASLARLKSVQENLNDLESERRDTERQNRQDAVMDALDTESDQLEDTYNQAIENNQKIWEQFYQLGVEAMIELKRKQDGYYNMTDEQQQAWNEDNASYIASLSNYGVNSSSTSSLSTSTPEVDTSSSSNVESGRDDTVQSTVDKVSTIPNTVNNSTNYNAQFGDTIINITGVSGNPTEVGNIVSKTFADNIRTRGISINLKK